MEYINADLRRRLDLHSYLWIPFNEPTGYLFLSSFNRYKANCLSKEEWKKLGLQEGIYTFPLKAVNLRRLRPSFELTCTTSGETKLLLVQNNKEHSLPLTNIGEDEMARLLKQKALDPTSNLEEFSANYTPYSYHLLGYFANHGFHRAWSMPNPSKNLAMFFEEVGNRNKGYETLVYKPDFTPNQYFLKPVSMGTYWLEMIEDCITSTLYSAKTRSVLDL
jgi:hypothetical protein